LSIGVNKSSQTRSKRGGGGIDSRANLSERKKKKGRAKIALSGRVTSPTS